MDYEDHSGAVSLVLSAAEWKSMFGLIQNQKLTTQVMINAVIKSLLFPLSTRYKLIPAKLYKKKKFGKAYQICCLSIPLWVLKMLIKT